MPRREYRSGSIYQRSSDWRLIASVETGFNADGSRKREAVSTAGCEGGCKPKCAHRSAIKSKLAAKQRAIARGESAQTRTTVKAWSDTWLRETSRTVRPKTHVTDKGAARYIVATIGHRRLTDLTPGDVRAVRDAVTEDGRSTSTALRYHGTLMRMLKAARDEGHDVPARVLAVRPPKKAVNDRTSIPIGDALSLLQAAGELPNGSRWLAAFLHGLRQGEALGLLRTEIAADTIRISWQLQALNYLDKKDRSKGFLIPEGYEVRQLKGRMHLVRPKSEAGWRVYRMRPELAIALGQWLEACPDSPYGLVWPGEKGWTDPVDDRAEFKALQDAAKVRHPSGRYYTVHEIRHTTGTMLLELGVPDAVRIQIMGHSSVASTEAYQHVDTSMADEALGRWAERLQLTPGAP